MASANRPFTPTDAAVGAALTYAWYALPDAIRSRGLRTVLKTGLAAAGGVYFLGTMRERDWQDLRKLPQTVADESVSPALIAGTLGVASIIGLAGESLIFRRGERRRRQGSSFAHSKQALVLGLLSAVTALIPDVDLELDDAA